MAPRDAFGRETGEDAPGVRAVSAPDLPRPPRGPGARNLASLAIVLLIAGGIAAAVIVGIGGEDKVVTVTMTGPAPAQAASTPSAPAAQGTAPPPARPRSLIRSAALSIALRKLQGRGRLRLLRVAPDRVDAQLVTGAGALRNVQVTAGGELRDFGTAGSGAGGLATIPLTQVDTAAPGRIVRAAARQSGRSPSRVDYLVLISLPGIGLSWNAYFKPDGLHFMADAHGSGLRRP